MLQHILSSIHVVVTGIEFNNTFSTNTLYRAFKSML